jgi:hypothetical protein
MVKFVKDVPTTGRAKYDWEKISAELKTKPGKWAVVEGKGVKGTPGAAHEAARRIRKGEITAMKEGFDATSRGNTVYAMYIGEDGS